MPDKSLTQTQRICVDYIKEYVNSNGYSPSIRDIKNHVGYKSTTSVVGILDALEDKGMISSTPGIARSIRLLKQEQAA